MKRLLAVLAVERPLRALSLIMALLFIEADSFFAGRAGDDHELALPLVVHLWKVGAYAEVLWQNGNLCTALGGLFVYIQNSTVALTMLDV